MKSRGFAVLLLLLAGSAFAQLNSNSIDRLDMLPASQPHRATGTAALELGYGKDASVSASELGAPARARKEFDKGNEALRKQDFSQARRHFEKAIAMYPAFASAYNNLGVVYARLGEADCERDSLQTALQLNDHFELAYVNWARMNIASANFAEAETTLRKASSLDSGDPIALVLLAYSELVDGHLQDAIATGNKAHALAKPHAFVHRVAARAYEQQNQLDRAIAELKLSLEEEPTGTRADSARQELRIVQSVRQ